jgi:hypothetical protein
MHRRTLQAAGITSDKIMIFRENSSFSIPTLSNYDIINVYIFVGKKPFTPTAKNTIRQIMNSNLPVVELSAEPNEPGKVAHDDYPFSIPSWNIGGSIYGFFLWVKSTYPWIISIAIVLVIILFLKVRINLAMGQFFLLGLSWMIVESMVLFHSFLILGNPALSTGIALGAFLCSNGIGSYISKYLQNRRKILILLPLLIILYTLMIPVLIPFLLGQSLYLRSIIFFMSVAMVGVFTGTMFPISLTTFKKDSVPRLFFIDLIGGGLAPLLFWLMFFIWGINAIAAIAVVGYVITILVLNRVKG